MGVDPAFQLQYQPWMEFAICIRCPTNFDLCNSSFSLGPLSVMIVSGLLAPNWKYLKLFMQTSPISRFPDIHLINFFPWNNDHSVILPHQLFLRSSIHGIQIQVKKTVKLSSQNIFYIYCLQRYFKVPKLITRKLIFWPRQCVASPRAIPCRLAYGL